jgi:hypothetical protein
VHAVACFQGNEGGYLGNNYWMFPWNPFQERVFSLRVSSLLSVQRLYISNNEAEKGRKGTWSLAATRIVLAKDARRAVAVDTVTVELT